MSPEVQAGTIFTLYGSALPDLSGVYCITNTVTGKLYIGSTQNFRKRRNCHVVALNQGKHTNRRMQAAFNKYGFSALAFSIKELCSVADLQTREQDWLDRFNGKGVLYNLLRTAYSTKGPDHPRFGKTHTEEARKKIREARARQVVSHSPATRKKMGEKSRGRKMPLEAIERMRASKIGKPAWNKGFTAADYPNLGHKITLPPSVYRSLLKRYNAGKSILTIAAEFRIGWGLVRRVLVEAGVPIRSISAQKLLYFKSKEFRP